MERLRELLQSREIGIDAWYDCYLEEATRLMRGLIDAGEQLACFGLLDELSEDAQVRFFEAVTSVEDLALVSTLLAIASRATPEIVEPIVDGLRSWSLAADDQVELRRQAVKLRGRSPVLDKIIDTIA